MRKLEPVANLFLLTAFLLSLPLESMRASETAEGIHELAVRLLSWQEGGPNVAQPRLHAGRLAPPLEAFFPAPPGARIVGSLERAHGRVDAVIDTVLTPEEAFQVVRDGLLEKGWSDSSESSDTSERNSGTFCAAEAGFALKIQTKKAASTTEIRVNLHKIPDCRQFLGTNLSPARKLVPELRNPANAISSGSGWSVSKNEYSQYRTIETTLLFDQVVDIYAQQLEAKGWKRIDFESTRTARFINLTLLDAEGQPWSGVLWAKLLNPVRGRYYVHVDVSKDAK